HGYSVIAGHQWTPRRSVTAALASPFAQQLTNLLLPCPLVDDAGVRVRDAAVAIDQERDRQILDVIGLHEIRVADDDRIRNRMLREIRLYLRPALVVHRGADRGQALRGVFPVELDVPGDFALAAGAPRRPEVEEHDAAFVA